MKTRIYGIILIALFVVGASASAQVAVIGNKSLSTASLDKAKLKNLYLLVSNEINGAKVKLFDLDGTTPGKEKIYDAVGKSAAEARKGWLKARLTGNGVPPETVATEEDMLAKVESTPGGIGYISADKVTSKVKTLLIIN